MSEVINEVKTVNLKINGMPLSVPATYTILEAAREVGIEIPTLCFLKEMNEIGACRICVVEVKGARSLVASCVFPVAEGMEVETNSLRVQNARKMTLELILSNHDRSCLSCIRSGNCELQKLCQEFGVEDESRFDGANLKFDLDDSAVHMVRDDNKCILCRRCIAACKNQQVAVIGVNDRGFDTHVGCAFDSTLGDVACISCGQCIVNCPTGALSEKDDSARVFEALSDPTKHVIVQTAPSIRVTLGECFGMKIGQNVTGKMVSALRLLGFDKVFDTNFAADLTIMEEANEFVQRVKNGGPLPLITSCSPGWVKFCEYYHPDLIPNLSSAKSPQQMFGAIIKTWYAEQNNINPKDIVVVGIMPCTAKKFEVGREHENASGVPDCDIALTTRELGRMINRAHIRFVKLPDSEFDNPLGEASGAGVIFGATGGVMEAALRTAVETLEGKSLEKIDFDDVRGVKHIKEATFNVAGMEVNVAVTSGMKYAHELLEKMKRGEKQYHFIEVMGCPGGCVNGGGQPVQHAVVRSFANLEEKRAAALYDSDRMNRIRKSHDNPMIKKLYEEYLGEPGSHLAHKILHTSYVDRSKDVLK